MTVYTVSSEQNPLLKEIRRAVSRGGLTSDGYCIAEGFHLLEEALRSDCRLGGVLAAASVRPTVELRLSAGTRLIELPDRLFQKIAATESSQGVLALVRPPRWELGQLFGPAPLVVILDGLQDPGNAGSIIRAAEAFAATGTIFLKGTVNPYNPKAVRASAGSIFRAPLLVAAEEDAVLQGPTITLYAATPRASLPLGQADFRRPCGLIIGSEGHGVRARLRAAATPVRIPTVGVESLNAAMAAGILLYEARRQRRNGEIGIA